MNKFCVYVHFRNDNSQPFYVGQGNPTRPRVSKRKNIRWNKIIEESNGFFYIIIRSGLTKLEALQLEQDIIVAYGDKVVNKKTDSSYTKELDFEYFYQKFYISADSPSGLRYKTDSDCRQLKQKLTDDIAGNKDPFGYWSLSYNASNYRVHRIIFLLIHGKIDPSMIIDHIDGDGLNNRPDNLRQVTHSDNRRNLSKDKRNISGLTGICEDKRGIIRCAISHNGARFTRSFSTQSYGKEKAMELAVAWYTNKREELNAAGAGYTERHGT